MRLADVVAQSAEARATALPQLQAITLAWNRSPSPDVTGYRLYYGPASGYTNAVDVGDVDSAQLLLPDARLQYAATAYTAAGEESTFSNALTVTGRQTVVSVSATDEASPDLVDWQPLGTREVYRGTNDPGSVFFRSRLEVNRATQWVTE